MFTKIRHVAIHTDNHFRMANFYKTLFGMKKITNGMTDEKGDYNPERGHLSDGVIGLALLQRQPGFQVGHGAISASPSRTSIWCASSSNSRIPECQYSPKPKPCAIRRPARPRSRRQSIRSFADGHGQRARRLCVSSVGNNPAGSITSASAAAERRISPNFIKKFST